MPKYSVIIFFSLFFMASLSKTHAAPNRLLQCLAKEEESLHKKSTQNALFRLNQDFVNELASANDIDIKNHYVDQICGSKTHSPSVELLRLLLIKENELYDLKLSGVDSSLKPFKMGYINEFQKQVPRIFIQYISGLQAELATADCLGKAISELEGFNEKIKYLEEEISTSQLLTQKNKIESIFNKLKNFSSIKSKCAQVQKKKLEALKKKQDAQSGL